MDQPVSMMVSVFCLQSRLCPYSVPMEKGPYHMALPQSCYGGF